MGAGTPLSAHAKLHDCGESDGRDRQGHSFGGGVVGVAAGCICRALSPVS